LADLSMTRCRRLLLASAAPDLATLSLHDALPICDYAELLDAWVGWRTISVPMRPMYTRFVELANEGAREIGYADLGELWRSGYEDRKSTRLNSSHVKISYAVFCLKKKTNHRRPTN